MKISYILALTIALLLTACGSKSSDSSGNSNSDETGVDHLVIDSVNDAKGYTFKTNAAESMSGYQVTLSVKCDGTYYYKDTGNGVTHVASGGSVTLEGLLLKWQGGSWTEGADSASNSTDGYLMLGTDHKLIAGSSCWLDNGTGGAQCPSSLFIQSITQDETCN